MPGQGIVVNIQAKIEGWQAQLKQIQDAMKNLKVGSEISKGLEKDLKQVETMINSLGKNMNHRLTSDSQITGFTDKVKEVEALFDSLGTRMSSINFNDLNMDYITANFKDLLTAIEAATQALSAGMETSLQGAIADSKELQKEFSKMKIDPKDLNMDQMREALASRGEGLAKDLQNAQKEADKLKQEMQSAIKVRDQLGQYLKNAGTNSNDKAMELLGGTLPTNGTILDENAIKAKRDQIRQGLLSMGITEGDLNKILPSVDKLMHAAKWDEIPKKLAEQIDRTKVINENKYNFAQQNADTAKDNWYKANGAVMHQAALVSGNTQAQESLEALIATRVQQETQALREKVEALEQQLRDQATAPFKGTGGNLKTNSAAGMQAATDAAAKYRAQLDQVKAGEQMLGKLQGVVQRWFSIYAVIRMVSNAIKQAAQNIQELDTTMTEIAIVTKMDQGDLWKQMPQYTAMAREYASSIKGVYEVSQIYYQQGLQMNDVMSLTESTLKMARISGLGYSEAADYMTNAIRSFKMEMTDATRVVDVYSAVAASSASNVTELATAMSKTASSAQAVGSSFESTTAMLAVMIEATRESPENIGSAMKSIISRYGELKENKVGIDEEGEEYSLNKVDKALQTVGISIHDAAGEFRDFDEVIFELAEHWNEIDKNTQRYIATVMAGNRQQSRFLALVSSSDRLKEEREKAENSEDASQLQFLKSLDSIDAKKQQLQTSIQSIYTDSGIENVYKGLLDFANQVLITFDNLSSNAGLGAAIAKIGATFMTLATLVTNVFSLIKGRMAIASAEITAQAKLAIAERLNSTENAASEEISIQQKVTESYLSEEEKRTAAHEANVARRNANTLKQEAKMKSLRMGGGMIFSTAGLALTTAAASLDVNKERETKTNLTGLGGVLSGLGTGLMIGGWTGAVMGVLTALPSVIEAIGMSTESVSEKVNRLQTEVQDARNQELRSKDELKTLTDYKKKYDELSRTQFDSAEKQKEFKDLQNEIAEKYPSLLASMDAEGNAVVNMASAYDALRTAKLGAYSTDFAISLGAELGALQDIDYILKEIYGVTPKSNTKGGLFNWFDMDTAEKFSQYFKYSSGYSIKNGVITANDNDLNTTDLGFWSLLNDNRAGNLTTLFNFKDQLILGDTHGGWLTNDTLALTALGQLYNFYNEQVEKGTAYEDINFDMDEMLTQARRKVSAVDADAVEAYWYDEEYRTNLTQGLQTAHISKEDYELWQKTAAAEKYQGEAQERLINSSASEYINMLDEATSDLLTVETNAVQKYAVANKTSEGLKKFLDAYDYVRDNEEYQYTDENGVKQKYDYAHLVQAYFDKNIQSKNGDQDIGAAEIFEKTGVNPVNQATYQSELQQYSWLTDEIDELYSNLGQFSKQDIIGKLGKLVDPEHYNEAVQLLGNAFDEQFGTIIERYTNWVQSIDIEDEQLQNTIKDFSNIFGPEFLIGIQEQYKDILKNTKLTDSQKQSQIKSLTDIYSAIDRLDIDIQDDVLREFQSADLTSINGIYDLFNELEEIEGLDLDFGYGKQVSQHLKELANKLNLNIEMEIESYFTSMESSAEGFEKALSSATGGMNLKDAKEMADKLGVSLKDFRVENGKFYFDDLEKIEEVYSTSATERMEALKENVTTRITNMSGKWAKGIAGRDLLEGGKSVKELEETFSTEEAKKEFSEKFNIEYDEFIKYYKQWKESESPLSFVEFISGQIDKELAESLGVIEKWQTQSKALSELKTGQIENFLKTTGNWKTAKDYEGIIRDQDEATAQAQKDNEELMDAIRSGMVENLPDNLKQFAKQIYDTYHSVYSSISSSMNAAISGGANQMFVDDTNISALQELYDQGFFKQKLDENGNVIKNYQLQKGDIVSLTDEVINGQKSLDTWINEHYTNATDKIKALSEYYSAVTQNTVQTSTDLMSKTGALEFEETAKYLQDVGAFDFGTQSTTSAEYAEVLKKYGLKFNETTGRFIIDDAEKYLAQLKADVEALGDNATLEERNAANAAYEAGINRVDKLRTEAIEKLFSNYNDLTAEDLESYANAFGMDYEFVKELVTDNGKGGFKLDLTKARQEINWAYGAEQITEAQYQLYSELIAKNIDEYLSNITNASSLVSKGTTKREDIAKFITQAKEVGLDLDESAFQYDDVLNAWTLKPEQLRAYVEAQKEQLKAAGMNAADIEDYINDNVYEQLANQIDIGSFLKAENKSATGQAYVTLQKSISNYLATSEELLDSALIAMINARQSEDSDQLKASKLQFYHAHYSQEDMGKIAADFIIEQIKMGGDQAVSIMKEVATQQGKELSASDIEAAYRVEVNEVTSALDQLLYSRGSIVNASTAKILNSIKGYRVEMIGDDVGIIRSIGDVADAYRAYYNALQATNEATVAELNSAMAKIYETKDGRAQEQIAIDMLGKAMGMTYSEFGEMLTSLGIEMTEDLMDLLEGNNVIESIGGNQMRITDFNTFAQSMGWEYGSELYMQALKSYNDSVIAQSEQESQELISEFTALSEARQGKQVNLTNFIHAVTENEEAEAEDYETYLKTLKLGERIRQTKGLRRNKTTGEYEEAEDSDEARAALKKLQANARAEAKKRMSEQLEAELNVYNASLENGILTLNEGANLVGIAQVLKSHANQAGVELEEDMATLADTIASIIKKYVDAINKGIDDTLTNVEAVQLNDYALSLGLPNISFEKTADGLKLSQEAAIELYYALQAVDKLQATLVFKKLNASLKENNEQYKSVTSIQGRILELNEKIAASDEEVSPLRKKQYEEELALAKEILLVRSTSEDESFNFMSNKIPGAQNNPINYYQNWAQAFQKVRKGLALTSVTTDRETGKKITHKGLIDYQDWYNIVTEMNNLASYGQEIELAGIKLNGSAERAAELIQKGAEALTIDSNGQVKVALGDIAGLGLDFKTGAQDMASNIDEGLRSYAQSQVNMLDGLIRILEAIVAFEQLGDIDVDGMGINLDDLFVLNVEGDEESGIKDFEEGYKTWRDNIIKKIEEYDKDPTKNKDLVEALRSIKLTIDGSTFSLEDMIQWKVSDFQKDPGLAKAYTALVNAMVQAAKSGNYDLDNIAESVQQELAAAGVFDQALSVDVGDITLFFSGTTHAQIDWSDLNTKDLINRIGAKTEEERQKAKDAISTAMQHWVTGVPLGDKELEFVLYLKKKITFKDGGTEVESVEIGGVTYTAAEMGDNLGAYLGAAALEEAGYGDYLKGKTFKGKSTEIEYEFENKTHMKIKGSTEGIQFQGRDGKYYDTQDKALYADYLNASDPSKSTGNYWKDKSFEEYKWEVRGIRAVVKNEIVGEDNKPIDITNNKELRDKLINLRESLNPENLDSLISKTTTGNYEVDFGGGIKLNLDGAKITDVNGNLDYSKLYAEISSMLGTDLGLVENITQGITEAFSGTTISDALGKAIATGLTSEGVPLDNLKINAEKVTADGDIKVEPIAEATGKITHLTVTAQTVDAEGNITGVEITGQLDGEPVKVVIDKESAKSDINEIQTALEALHGKVTVQVGQTGVDAVQKAINGIQGKTVKVRAIYAGGNVEATGNVGLAKAQGTLMGELGPELVVSQGRYFVAGQNGPEMVDLADDAIVFNHLQTKSLLEKGMSSGRGRAVTNEYNAISYAKGNVEGGPAMASASAALSALRQLRAMWAKLAQMSASDLAKKGGGGGGGGGQTPFIKELERWYNWLQKIAQLEREINLEEAKRSKYATSFSRSGGDYARSQKTTLDHLQQEVAVQKNLNAEQEKYLKNRIEQANNDGSPWRALYKFTDEGAFQYDTAGYAWLSELFGTDEHGKPKYTAEEQYNAIIAKDKRFADYMDYDESGKPLEKKGNDWYATAIQNFNNFMDSDKEEFESLAETINEGKISVEKLEQQRNEILKEMEDNQIAVEQKVLKAVEESRQRQIDEAQKERDAIEKGNQALLDGLNNQLQKEQEMYSQQQEVDELAKLQRQLVIMQRTGGSAAGIADLQQQIADKQQSMYFEEQQKQIEALQEASDNELERLDHQIEIMQETLDYEKEHGLLWNEVYKVLEGTPEKIEDYIIKNTSEYWNTSATELAKKTREDLFALDKFKELQIAGGMEAMIAMYNDSKDDEAAEEEKKKTDEEEAAAAAAGGDTSVDTGSSGGNSEPSKKTQYKVTYTIYDEKGFQTNWGGYGVGATEAAAKAAAEKLAKSKTHGSKYYSISYGKATKYASGGLITKPTISLVGEAGTEGILNADQTTYLRNKLISSRPDSFVSAVDDFFATLEADKHAMMALTSANNDGYAYVNIEHASVNLQIDKLANDYDSKRAANTIMQEMLRIASKSASNNSVGR